MNKVILMGRLTANPELRYTSTNNTALCNFTLAVDRRFSKPGENKQTDFFNITAWKNNAEFCSKYFAKGSKIIVVGSLQNRSWDDKDGKKHTVTEVIADEFYFAESRKAENQPAEGTPYPMDDEELPFR
jgi:single-strand DNA-binding protein